MSNYEAQAFRDAASRLIKDANSHRRVENVAEAERIERDAKLLLAAAEQREQWDACLVRYDEVTQQMNTLDKRRIATLTAEYGAVLLKLDTCRGEAAKERHALTAQLDAMNVVLTETAHSYRHLREQFDEGLRMLASKDAERHALNAQLDLYMAENEALHAQIATLMAEGE